MENEPLPGQDTANQPALKGGDAGNVRNPVPHTKRQAINTGTQH